MHNTVCGSSCALIALAVITVLVTSFSRFAADDVDRDRAVVADESVSTRFSTSSDPGGSRRNQNRGNRAARVSDEISSSCFSTNSLDFPRPRPWSNRRSRGEIAAWNVFPCLFDSARGESSRFADEHGGGA